MRSASVPRFRPSVHGFRFANRWPAGPTVRLGPLDPRRIGIGDASAGLCGGMVATVRDLFEAGIAPPPDVTPPPNGSARFRSVVRRQVESLAWGRVPLRYYDLQAFRPDQPRGLAALLGREPARVTAYRDEWPRIRADIDAGILPVVGLIRVAGWSPRRLTTNHQVLAYGYEEDDAGARIRVYDPNHPGPRRRRAAGRRGSRRRAAGPRADPTRPVDRRAAARLLPTARPAATPLAGRLAARPGRPSFNVA